jgi:FkbM family methyltransferase
MSASREKFLVRMLYPVIDRLFPAPLASKIKMCGCILVGDWMIPYNFTSCDPSYLRNHSSADIVKKNFPGLSEDASRDMISYFERLRRLLPTWEDQNFRFQIFLKSDFAFSRAELAANRREDREAIRRGKAYGIDFQRAEATSLIYHHGLTLVPEKVLQYIENKDFIDAGAYDGASCLVFQQYAPRCVFAFEPSKANQQLFAQTLNRNRIDREKYRLIGKGLADVEGTVAFDDTGDAVNDLSKKGEQLAEITTVDLFAKANNLQIGVIKADVEGMGLKVIQGCLETLKNSRPVLLLSVYHHPDELFGIYNFLFGLSLSYKIFFKPLHRTINEMTLIAYPEELS